MVRREARDTIDDRGCVGSVEEHPRITCEGQVRGDDQAAAFVKPTTKPKGVRPCERIHRQKRKGQSATLYLLAGVLTTTPI